jgi:hypothetical protein
MTFFNIRRENKIRSLYDYTRCIYVQSFEVYQAFCQGSSAYRPHVPQSKRALREGFVHTLLSDNVSSQTFSKQANVCVKFYCSFSQSLLGNVTVVLYSPIEQGAEYIST